MNKNKLVAASVIISLAILFYFVCVKKSANEQARSGNPGEGVAPVSEEAREKSGTGRDSSGVFGFLNTVFSSKPPTPPSRPTNELLDLMEELSKQEELPQVAFIPTSYESEDIKGFTENLKRISLLSKKVRSSDASKEEKKELLNMKITLLQKKIANIKDFMNVKDDYTPEKNEPKKEKDEDAEKANKMIETLEKKITEYKSEL
ncbi:MAG: hypothetical protein MUD12_02575 [Spirochaetes bacterium]|jgi:hypothetical protein|nr:hypothetical protein [Spirochaetota bacterium]